MKAHKLRWNPQKRVWYGKTDRDTIIGALDEAYRVAKKDTATENTNGGRTNGREEQADGDLDRNRGRGRLPSQYAEKELAQGSGNLAVADRDSGESRTVEGGSGRALLRADSEGVRVEENALKELAGTSVVDAEGHIIAVYHSTNAEFSEFNKGDIGFHFGNMAQAEDRAKQKKYDNPKFIRAYLNIRNSVSSPRDPMSWNAKATVDNLWSLDILNDSEWAEVNRLYKRSDDEYNSAAAIRLREILDTKGYDGIVYPNGFEGKGLSYIAFRNDQIIITENQSAEKNEADVNEEAKANGKVENADHREAVREPDADGQGASRLLDESQKQDVPRAASERDSLGDTGQREPETSRDGDRADTADRTRGSCGSRYSGSRTRPPRATSSSSPTSKGNWARRKRKQRSSFGSFPYNKHGNPMSIP